MKKALSERAKAYNLLGSQEKRDQQCNCYVLTADDEEGEKKKNRERRLCDSPDKQGKEEGRREREQTIYPTILSHRWVS